MSNENWLKLIDSLVNEQKPDVRQLNVFHEKYGRYQIPPDYGDFISSYNGAEGPIGQSDYLALWTLENVIEINGHYEDAAMTFSEKFIIVGSNGGVFSYAINKEKGSFHKLDLFDDSYDEPLGASFIAFLQSVSK